MRRRAAPPPLTTGLVVGVLAATLGIGPARGEGAPAATVRLDEREFVARPTDRGTYRVHCIIRIERPGGDEHAKVWVPRGDYVHIRSIEGVVRDSSGKKMRDLEDEDVLEVDISPSGTLASDSAFRWFSLTHHAHPYEIEYRYELGFDSLLLWPSWSPQREIPVEEAILRLEVEDGVEFRTRWRGAEREPEVREDHNRTTYEWRVGPLEAKGDREGVPPEDADSLRADFAPASFRLGTVEEIPVSWNGLASWYQTLAKGRYELDGEAREEVARWVAEARTEREIVERVHRQIQSKCRYVAIELGLGSWRPTRAREVYRNRYGDCKDLSTLTIAMLAAAGVRAYPALTLTRNRGVVEPGFPSNSFNHCITFVPLEADTMWVECTSPYHEAGDLPASVEGADALVVSDEGGLLLRTPTSQSHDNLRKTTLTGTLTREGALDFQLEHAAFGNAGDALRPRLAGMSKDERHAWATRVFGRFCPRVELNNLTLEGLEVKSDHPLRLRARGSIPGFAQIIGDRILLNPSFLHRVEPNRPDLTDRELPFFVSFPSVRQESLIVKMPRGFHIESAPAPVEIESPVGTYRSAHAYSVHGEFRHERTFAQTKRLVEPAEFMDLGELMETAASRDWVTYSFRKRSRR